MKKILLTILMVSFVINAQAWSDFCIDSLDYKITSDTLPYTVEVSDYTTGIVHAIIPETVTYSGITYSVTKIEHNVFWHCSSLRSVIIGDNVKSIEYYAFADCSSLRSVIIGDNVDSIEYHAFEDCSSLRSITIPKSVRSINYMVFSGCTSLESVIIGDNVESIEHSAFQNCSSLRSITIPKSVRSISHGVFRGCTSLESVIFESETPPYLSHGNFDNTAIPIYVPCGCVEAYKQGSGNWYELSNIQEHPAEYSITVYSSDKTMGVADAKNSICGNQISAKPNYGYHFVQWSDGVTDNPRTLILTQDTTFTAEFAQTFSGQCGDNLYWSYQNNTLTISGFGDMYDNCPWGLFAAEINDVVLPNAMTYIGSSAFYGCSSLTSVTIPNSVTSIGDYAFAYCSSLTSVTIPNSVTSIGSSAFYGCSSLTSVTIPNSVTSIGNYAFKNCEKLGTLVLGDKVKNIGDYAFEECNKLYHIYCYAPEPPVINEDVFTNYNVNLYVPCNYLDNYKYDRVFGSFRYIQCIDSEDVTTNDVVVTPGTNDVTITWPTEGNADTYTIVIKKGNEIFCTLTFNADGQLLNIAFAPGRDGNHPVQYAEQAGNGYRFTVTGLEEGTHYAYNIDVRDTANKTIKSYTGEFTTESMTVVENITTNNANIQKILRDGQLYIYHNGKTYTVMGAEVK